MTLFTNSPFEKMMIQKPGYQKRDKSPPADIPPPAAWAAPTWGSPLVTGTVSES